MKANVVTLDANPLEDNRNAQTVNSVIEDGHIVCDLEQPGAM
jgi:hypothetical protein